MRFAPTLLLLAVLVGVALAGNACPFAAAEAGELVNDESFIRAAFAKFQKDNTKVYASNSASEVRFQFFRANYLRAMELNAKHNELGGTVGRVAYGVTPFMDLSADELRSRLGELSTNTTSDRRRVARPAASASLGASKEPELFNWRAVPGVVTPVRDMGGCAASWAFSVVAAIEGAAGVRYGNNTSEDAWLSPQHPISCDDHSDGCSRGSIEQTYAYMGGFGGAIRELEYPYKAREAECRASRAMIHTRLVGYYYAIAPCSLQRACLSQDEEALARVTAQHGPATACVNANEDWFLYKGKEPLRLPCERDFDSLNLCLTIDALERSEDGEGYNWVLRNAWGGGWGDRGHVRLAYGENRCGLADLTTFPVIM